MQPNELTAVLNHTNVFAVYPAHVEVDLPYYVNSRASRNGRRGGQLHCPSGMVRATVIENGAHWVEKRPVVVCGDRDYEIPRRNGVLVEFDPDDLPKGAFRIVANKVYTGTRKGPGASYPHTEVVTREGKKFIRMIIARKAIISAWDEYAMEIARREKEEAEQQAKYNRLRDAQCVLMGVDDPKFMSGDDNKIYRQKFGYLSAEYQEIRYDDEGERLPEKDRKEIGHIEITIEQAELLISLLSRNQRKMLKQS
jgi:hypothetical protein